MVQPIDYLGMLPQVDLGQSLLSGIQAGSALGAIRDKRQADEQAKAMQAQYSADLEQTLANPTAQNFAALTAKYPKQREAFKQSWEILDKDQQDAEFGAGAKVYSALRNGRPDAALQVLDQQIAAMENTGQDVSDLKNIRAQIQRDPNVAAGHVGLVLSSVDPDRWSKVATEMRASEQAPFDLTEKQAKAQKAAVDAKFAESMAVQDLQKKGWEIAKLQEDTEVSRQNSKIAAINAQIARETKPDKINELRQKMQGEQAKRDTAIREKAAEIATARSGIDNSLSVIDRLIKNPELDNILGAVEGGSFYPGTLVGLVSPFSDADKRADAMADLENIQSQSFLNNLMDARAKGATFGDLTEKEGDRLINYVRNLSQKQSEGQFRSNLSEVQRLLLKSRSSLSDRYGVPDVTPDTPAVAPSPNEIDALLQKYGS